jgi:hypothetical protein
MVKGLDEEDTERVKCAVRLIESTKDSIDGEFKNLSELVDSLDEGDTSKEGLDDQFSSNEEEKTMNEEEVRKLLEDMDFSQQVKEQVEEVLSEKNEDLSTKQQIQQSDDLDEEVKSEVVDLIEKDDEPKEKDDLSLEEALEQSGLDEEKQEVVIDLYNKKEKEDDSQVEEVKKENQKLKERLEKLEDERKEQEFKEKYADEFKRLPISKEDGGVLMKELDESLSEETFEKVESLLKSADEALKEAGLLERQSKSDSDNLSSQNDLMKEAEEIAEEEGITKSQAVDQLIEKHPDKASELISTQE